MPTSNGAYHRLSEAPFQKLIEFEEGIQGGKKWFVHTENWYVNIMGAYMTEAIQSTNQATKTSLKSAVQILTIWCRAAADWERQVPIHNFLEAARSRSRSGVPWYTWSFSQHDSLITTSHNNLVCSLLSVVARDNAMPVLMFHITLTNKYIATITNQSLCHCCWGEARKERKQPHPLIYDFYAPKRADEMRERDWWSRLH